MKDVILEIKNKERVIEQTKEDLKIQEENFLQSVAIEVERNLGFKCTPFWHDDDNQDEEKYILRVDYHKHKFGFGDLEKLKGALGADDIVMDREGFYVEWRI